MGVQYKGKKFNQKSIVPGYEQKHNNPIISLQRKNDTIAMLLDGRAPKEIRQHLVSRYGLKPGSANIFIQHARTELKKRQELEINDVINLHIHRYEEIFAKLRELGSNVIAMDCLKQKEKLLQFHREGFQLKVTKGEMQTVMLQQVDDEYDLNRFTPEEKERFLQILSKSKKEKDGPTKDQ